MSSLWIAEIETRHETLQAVGGNEREARVLGRALLQDWIDRGYCKPMTFDGNANVYEVRRGFFYVDRQLHSLKGD